MTEQISDHLNFHHLDREVELFTYHRRVLRERKFLLTREWLPGAADSTICGDITVRRDPGESRSRHHDREGCHVRFESEGARYRVDILNCRGFNRRFLS